ncbi:M16 family metallopeptidase [Ketogulonicigenium vulgare]|uniref:M16 family metallopeptidase n=1 Tax=Ketogulonicigenium vulgare TaxID=92945 RepID=UPI002359B073|nr:pitrilysin family protein [Ketogulonicigenium vulgare]
MTVQIHTLSNGFRIATEVMPGLQSATIGIWVSAGGRHEAPQENGIAHFLEHMAFKGTKTRSALQIAEAIEDVGGYINAYTSRETTAYYARVLSGDTALALNIVADILLNPTFDLNEIEVERGVILQEIGQALDTPDDIIFDWLQEVCYQDQAIGRSILGPAERVSNFQQADLRRFVAQHYTPEQMILCAAGGVDHDAIVRQAESLFGHLPPANRLSAIEPARFTVGERREIKKSLEQVHFALAIEGPGVRAPDIYTAQLWSTALGGGMSSRLFQEVREKRGLCYTIFAQTGASEDTGATTIYAGTSSEQILDLSRITMTELARAADDLSQAELDRARAQMKAGLLMGQESSSNRAERLARMLALWGRVPDLSEAVAKIDAVNLSELRGFAAQMAAAPMSLALYGPADQAPSLADLKARLAA